jgi:hypothetical protein
MTLIVSSHSKQNPTSAPVLIGFNIFSMIFVFVRLAGIVAPALVLANT